MAILEKKDLLGLRDTSVSDIRLILDTAFAMRQILDSPSKKTAHLAGKSVVLFFLENSTRTRLSFEFACKYLGANSSNISGSGSSIRKGENLYDTIKTIEVMASDMIVMRHMQSGAPWLIAPQTHCSIINAGDGMNEHPTQALLDMMTMEDKLGKLEGLEVAIIGDALHSRVVRSNIWGLSKMGAKVRVCAPPTMLPRELDGLPCEVISDVREACEGVDVVMGLRVQLERQKSALFPSVREYAHFFGIDHEAIQAAKENALIMHPGPCNHGVEMPTEIHEHPQSVIHEQVTNGVAIRMAILFLLQARRNALSNDLNGLAALEAAYGFGKGPISNPVEQPKYHR